MLASPTATAKILFDSRFSNNSLVDTFSIFKALPCFVKYFRRITKFSISRCHLNTSSI